MSPVAPRPRRSVARVLAGCLGVGLAWMTGACVSDDGGAARPATVPPAGAVVASPFSPAGIRVLPLTHFERTASGETRVLLFFELTDQWGDTVKGAGELGVSARLGGTGGDARDVEWSIDLADLDRNAALYDPSTRAYRLALKDLPGWLIAASSDPATPATLEVYFRTLGSDGRPVVLRDRFPLGRPG